MKPTSTGLYISTRCWTHCLSMTFLKISSISIYPISISRNTFSHWKTTGKQTCSRLSPTRYPTRATKCDPPARCPVDHLPPSQNESEHFTHHLPEKNEEKNQNFFLFVLISEIWSNTFDFSIFWICASQHTKINYFNVYAVYRFSSMQHRASICIYIDKSKSTYLNIRTYVYSPPFFFCYLAEQTEHQTVAARKFEFKIELAHEKNDPSYVRLYLSSSSEGFHICHSATEIIL